MTDPTLQDIHRLGRQVLPVSQTIHLTLDARRPDFTGSVRVELDVRETVLAFRLHARDLRFDRLTLNQGEHLIAATHTGERGWVTITVASELHPGLCTLEIEFSGKFSARASSLYRGRVGEDWYAFTQFESDDARGAFPCWDEPCFKIPYQLTLTIPSAHQAISNTPVKQETTKVGWKTLEFERTKPVPTYLLAIITGPLETVPVPGMGVPGCIATPRGQTHLAAEAVKVTAPILKALEDYFGRPYPYEKLDQIAVPEFWFGAMENPGAVTYTDTALLMDSRAASALQRKRLVTIIAHEFSHMWFGNLVTMEWWDDLWLNESFASWMGDKISDRLFPELCVADAEINGADRAMLTDAKLSTRAIRQPVRAQDNLMQSADELAYQKGQRVLGMFERWIGPDRFRHGVLDYLARHEWGNARAADLWAALSSASGRDLTAAMSTFLDQGGVPLLSIDGDGETLRLSQRRFLNFGQKEQTPALWKIPVSLRFSDGSVRDLLFEDPHAVIALDGKRPEWIHPNVNEQGYCRWKIPSEMLRSMTRNAPEHLNTRERIGLLANLSALLDAGEVRGDEYLQVLADFAADPHPGVVGGVLDALAKVRQVFLTPDLAPAFASFLRCVVRPALDRFGLTRQQSEVEGVSFLRPRLLYLLADDGGDEALVKHGESLAAAYLTDPASVDPALAAAALRIAALHGDAASFAAFRQKFETAAVPVDRQRLLQALGDFRDDRLVNEAIAYVLAGPLRPQEIFVIPRVVAMGALKNENRAFEWMTANYDAIVDRIPPEQGAYLARFADGCSLDRLEAAQRFFTSVREKEAAHGITGTERELAKVADSVRNCVSLREREGAAVAGFLKGIA